MSDIEQQANILLHFVATIGVASRNSNPAATGVCAAALYSHVVNALPHLVQTAITKLENQLEPELLAGLSPEAREGECAAYVAAQRLFDLGYMPPGPPDES